MQRRLVLVLVLVLAFLPSLAVAQSLPLAERVPEPPVPAGVVALRIRNDTDCLIGLRAKADGTVAGYARVEPRGGTLWLHLKPDAHALAVEVLATPQFCPAHDSAVAPARMEPSLTAWRWRPRATSARRPRAAPSPPRVAPRSVR